MTPYMATMNDNESENTVKRVATMSPGGGRGELPQPKTVNKKTSFGDYSNLPPNIAFGQNEPRMIWSAGGHMNKRRSI